METGWVGQHINLINNNQNLLVWYTLCSASRFCLYPTKFTFQFFYQHFYPCHISKVLPQVTRRRWHWSARSCSGLPVSPGGTVSPGLLTVADCPLPPLGRHDDWHEPHRECGSPRTSYQQTWAEIHRWGTYPDNISFGQLLETQDAFALRLGNLCLFFPYF